jgi:hypothetical protein
MKLLRASVFFILLCPPAYAAEIEVGPGVCDTLVQYVPDPGVNYQPGVDAGGNPVVPADVGGGQQIQFPKHFTIAVTDQLAATLANNGGATTPSGVVAPQAFFGTITVDGDHLAFNGQPLGNNVDGPLLELCQKARQPQ